MDLKKSVGRSGARPGARWLLALGLLPVVLAVACNKGMGMDHGNMNHGGDAGHTGMPPQVMDLPASEGALDSAAFVDKSPEPGVIEVDLEARPAEVESLPGRKTVNVPAKSTLRLSVRFDGFPGMWMSHCHILEHGERGMMGELDVSS